MEQRLRTYTEISLGHGAHTGEMPRWKEHWASLLDVRIIHLLTYLRKRRRQTEPCSLRLLPYHPPSFFTSDLLVTLLPGHRRTCNWLIFPLCPNSCYCVVIALEEIRCHVLTFLVKKTKIWLRDILCPWHTHLGIKRRGKYTLYTIWNCGG